MLETQNNNHQNFKDEKFILYIYIHTSLLTWTTSSFASILFSFLFFERGQELKKKN